MTSFYKYNKIDYIYESKHLFVIHFFRSDSLDGCTSPLSFEIAASLLPAGMPKRGHGGRVDGAKATQRGIVMARLQPPAAVDVDALDWPAIENDLDVQGSAVVGPLLSTEQCRTLREAYDDESLYRKKVIMARHGFGSGEYRYYAYPLPSPIAALRTALYPHLARVANRWNAVLGLDTNFPATLEAFKKRCHEAGQDVPCQAAADIIA